MSDTEASTPANEPAGSSASAEASGSDQTVPWPVVSCYSGGASLEGVAGRVWIRLGDGPEEVEYVPASQGRVSGAAPVVQEPRKHWPFAESPGEFAARLESALREFGAVLPAVRHVLIETPPAIVQVPLTDEQLARLWFDAEYGPGHTVAPGYAVTFARAIEAAHNIRTQEQSAPGDAR